MSFLVRIGSLIKTFIRNLFQVAVGVAVIIGIVYVINSPALIELIKDVALGALKLLGVFVVSGLALNFLYRWTKLSAERDDGRQQALDYISRYFPLKFIAAIPDLIFRPKEQLKELITRRSAWLSAVLLLLASVAVSTGVEKFLILPPTELSAAAVVYYVAADIEESGKGDFGRSIETVLGRIDKKAEAPEKDAVSKKLIERILPLRWGLQPDSEVYSSVVYPGLSVLNLYLEWTYDVRAASDLREHYAADSAEREAFTKILDKWRETRFIEKLKLDGILMIWPLVFALILWAGVRQLPLGVAVGASFYLFGALVLTYQFVYIVGSTVVVLMGAEFLAFIALFWVFEMWVLVVLPEELRLPDLRCCLVGNAAMLLVVVVDFAIERLVLMA